MPVFVAAYGLQLLAGGSGSIVMHVAGQPACDSHIPLLVWTLKRRTCMIRLEKAGREDLATLVQLQEMVRARLLPEGQSLPEAAGDTLEDFFAHGVVLRALMEDDTMVGAVCGREVDGRQHLARLLVHPQWQGQYVETMLLLQMESLLPEARRELLFPARDAADLRPLLWLGYTVSEETALPHGLTLYRLEKGE